MRSDQKLYEAAALRGYLHCFRLVISVQKLYDAVITSQSVHNLFEIGLMKGVCQCLRPSTFDDIVHRSRTESTEKIYTVADKQDQQ